MGARAGGGRDAKESGLLKLSSARAGAEEARRRAGFNRERVPSVEEARQRPGFNWGD